MSDPRHNDRELDDAEVEALYSFGTSSYRLWPSIAHYYGDPARQLMIGAAALMLIASPLYGNNLRVEFPFEVVGALIAVSFAALTNPRASWISVGDAVISGVGMIVFATWGIIEYDTINPIAFVLRLAVALLFLFSFYFSMKTVRAFMLHQIGKRETVDEFDDTAEEAEDVSVSEQRMEISSPANSSTRFKPERGRKRPVDEGARDEEVRRARISADRKKEDDDAQHIVEGRA